MVGTAARSPTWPTSTTYGHAICNTTAIERFYRRISNDVKTRDFAPTDSYQGPYLIAHAAGEPYLARLAASPLRNRIPAAASVTAVTLAKGT